MAKRRGLAATAEHIERRMVPDPAMTDAEFWHRKGLKPDNPNIGMVEASVNMRELIGGFRHYTKRTLSQTMAAARFKRIYDACVIGGARAIDLESPIVDTSFRPATVAVDYGDAAREQYKRAVRDLGMRRSNLVEKVIVFEVPQRRLQLAYGFHSGGSGRIAIQTEVYVAMDALAEHFRLGPRSVR